MLSWRSPPGPALKSDQQHRVGRYSIDFAWPGPRIALEIDGWLHEHPEQAAKDFRRDSWLRSQGWLIFHADDRFGLEAMESQVRRFVDQLRLSERTEP